MMQNKPAKNAMDKILQGEIKQIPKWHFIVKNVVLWIVGSFCVIAGAMTVSLIIFTFANSALDVRHIVRYNFLQHVMIALPLLWILITIVFAILFDFFIRHTKQGYKYSLKSIIFINILLSIIFGTVFYFFGVSHIVDNVLGEHFKRYHSIEKRQVKLFNNPDAGMIIGRVVEFGEKHFVMMTPQGGEWYIVNEYIPGTKRERMQDGMRLIVIGKKIDENIFVACDVQERGIAGRNMQVRKRQMQKMQTANVKCTQKCAQNLTQMPENIDAMVKAACTHLKIN